MHSVWSSIIVSFTDTVQVPDITKADQKNVGAGFPTFPTFYGSTKKLRLISFITKVPTRIRLQFFLMFLKTQNDQKTLESLK